MTDFYTCEGESALPVWIHTNARTLSAAKAVARKRQVYQGTMLRVAERTGGMVYKVRAIAAADALDMAHKATWQDIE
jgi:hypothetical protein